MKLTYDGDFGAVPEQFGGETGFGLPDLSALASPSRGVELLGTFDARAVAEIARDTAWRPRAALDAAIAWDAGTGGAPFNARNPWLGETALPAPGQPHPLK